MAAKKKVPRTVMGAVIDRSGSMQAKRNETIIGYNTWLKDQQQLPDKAVLVRTLFSHEIIVDSPVDVKDAAFLVNESYQPDGYTALLDAVMDTILAMEATSKKGDRFLLLIITDGQENASTRYSASAIRQAITERQAGGLWTVAYQGCQADAWGSAQAMGVQAGNFQRYADSGYGTQNAFKGMSASTSSYRAGAGGQSVSFYGGDPDPDPPVDPQLGVSTSRLSSTQPNLAQPPRGRRKTVSKV